MRWVIDLHLHARLTCLPHLACTANTYRIYGHSHTFAYVINSNTKGQKKKNDLHSNKFNRTCGITMHPHMFIPTHIVVDVVKYKGYTSPHTRDVTWTNIPLESTPYIEEPYYHYASDLEYHVSTWDAWRCVSWTNVLWICLRFVCTWRINECLFHCIPLILHSMLTYNTMSHLMDPS